MVDRQSFRVYGLFALVSEFEGCTMVLIFFFRGVIVCKAIHSEPVVMSTKSSIQEGVSLAKDPSIKALHWLMETLKP